LERIQIIKKAGGNMGDSYLEDGFILNKHIGVGCPRRLENATMCAAVSTIRCLLQRNRTVFVPTSSFPHACISDWLPTPRWTLTKSKYTAQKSKQTALPK
jgi:hypothetical protein